MTPRFRQLTAAFYTMLGRSQMSRRMGDWTRANIQLKAANRLIMMALKA